MKIFGQSLRFDVLASIFAMAMLTSCTKAPQGGNRASQAGPSESPSERSFDVRGVLHGIDPADLSVTVEHEDIPGFMPSMTMPFSVKNPEELNGLTPGKAIAFRFIVTDTDSWITGVKTIDRASVQLPENKPGKKSKAPRIKEGDALPEFDLVDQNNRPLTRETFAGKTTVLTFIFTRCPIPDFCPLMQQNFSDLQKRIEADPPLAKRVQLLSISFDPEDTPETLARYAAGFTKDTTLWRHAGGSQVETEKLTHAFSVYVQAENGSYSHGLCTALVLPDGTVSKIWRGNNWGVDEVWQALQAIKGS